MLTNIYSKKEVIEYLKNNSIFPSKNRGQNFLCDKNITMNIANTIASNCERGKYAIEIGGGLGALSNILFSIYKNELKIVEYDNALYNHLKEIFPNVIHKDILKVDINDIDKIKKYDVYGNIPYNIASPIIEWLFCQCYNRWNYAVFMVQKDFADRLIAKVDTENYSSLTLFAKFMSNIKLKFNVSKEVFYPIPKVESAVIEISPKKVDIELLKIFQLVSKTIFHNRRKNIKNNLSNSPYLKLEKEKIDKILEMSGINSSVRGESLEIYDVEKLSKIILENK